MRLVLPLLVVLLLAPTPTAAQAAACSDYSTQAAAQRAVDTRDADGDGIYCESLPCPCLSSSSPAGPVQAPPVLAPSPPAGVRCGKERQTVKTLQDAGASRVNFNPVASTVEQLRAMPPPALKSSSSRLLGEFSTYRLRVRLRSYKLEDDADVHWSSRVPPTPPRRWSSSCPTRPATDGPGSPAVG